MASAGSSAVVSTSNTPPTTASVTTTGHSSTAKVVGGVSAGNNEKGSASVVSSDARASSAAGSFVEASAERTAHDSASRSPPSSLSMMQSTTRCQPSLSPILGIAARHGVSHASASRLSRSCRASFKRSSPDAHNDGEHSTSMTHAVPSPTWAVTAARHSVPPPSPPPTTQRAEPQHCTKIFVSISNSRASSGWRPSARIAFCTAVWGCSVVLAVYGVRTRLPLGSECRSDPGGPLSPRTHSDAKIRCFWRRFLPCLRLNCNPARRGVFSSPRLPL